MLEEEPAAVEEPVAAEEEPASRAETISALKAQKELLASRKEQASDHSRFCGREARGSEHGDAQDEEIAAALEDTTDEDRSPPAEAVVNSVNYSTSSC